MEISEKLLCLFSAQVEQQEDSYTIEIPKQELQLGEIDKESTYRVAVMPTSSQLENEEEEVKTEPEQHTSQQRPPVKIGEQRTVTIEDIGDQGDGIARVERGYIVIVPDAGTGEEVRIEISDVQQNVAFSEVVERLN